ncbi:MAG: type 4a pilus biogenesis protein PilO [Actinomycetota bacterium]|nr:type 4a pilus biogenesis protein PilO [Actinomycetota bacterium]
MTRRNSIILAVVGLAAVAAVYWFMLLAPKREQATTLNTKIAAKQVELQAAQAELATNDTARASYRSNFATVARLGKAVPADDDVRSLMIQIDGAAGSSHVDFRTISVGGGSTPAAPTDPTAATPSTAPPPGSAPVGTAGFSAMPFSLSFKGNYFNLGDFFQRVDRFVSVRDRGLDVTGRLMLLNSIELVPDGAFPKIKAQISATTYLVPQTQGLLGGATPQGPAAGASKAPAGSATPAPASPATTTATISGAHR